ncbi:MULTISPECIES: hypothetical protein [Sporomusa]|jgi:hypothetical protein|nr:MULTISPECIES: hypothetical protein [Sporomusa]HML31754.1 hypothetical protein [Sporomusa sphaeroides]
MAYKKLPAAMAGSREDFYSVKPTKNSWSMPGVNSAKQHRVLGKHSK